MAIDLKTVERDAMVRMAIKLVVEDIKLARRYLADCKAEGNDETWRDFADDALELALERAERIKEAMEK